MWSLTAGVLWETDTEGIVDFYAKGSLGAYHLRRELRVPQGTVWFPGICDEWYWDCIPGGPVEINEVDFYSSTYFGGNVGIGVTFALETGVMFYLEARYEYADTSGASTEWVPFLVGVRW